MAEYLLKEPIRQQLAVDLFRAGVFVISESGLPERTGVMGRNTPHWINIEAGITDPITRESIASNLAMLMVAKETPAFTSKRKANVLGYNHILGDTQTMSIFATNIADRTKGNLLCYRPPATLIGRIVGRFTEGDNVAVLSSAVSSRRAFADVLATVSDSGLMLGDFFSLVDKEEGYVPELSETSGIEVISAIGVAEMTKTLRDSGEITQAQFGGVARYMEQYGEPAANETLAA